MEIGSFIVNNWKKLFSTLIGVIFVALVVCGITGCGPFGDSNGGNDSNVPEPNPPNPNPPGDNLPPDPGAEGRTTLLGVDSDNDGVRDDIQRYIAVTYADSAKTRAALTEYAKLAQKQLADAGDKNLSIEHAIEEGSVLACIFYIDPDSNADALFATRAEFLNTEERSRAYIQYDEQLGGEVFKLQPDDASSCQFDVNSLPN